MADKLTNEDIDEMIQECQVMDDNGHLVDYEAFVETMMTLM